VISIPINCTLLSHSIFSTDIFVLKCHTLDCTVSVRLWNHFTYQFENLASANLTLYNITNVITADMDFDGKLDVLVSYDTNKMKLFVQGMDLTLTPSPWIFPQSSDQLMLVDENGDFRLDLFGNNEFNQPMFWLNKPWGFNETKLLNSTSKLTYPINAGYVDIDGDCAADLVLVTNNSLIEIYLKRGTDYVLSYNISVPSDIGQLSFSDLNRDGNMDILFVDHTNNTIYVLYNQQIGPCATLQPWNCRSFTNPCVSSEFHFIEHRIYLDSNNSRLANIKLDQFIIPSTVRVGDIFQSSFPSILLTLVDSTGVNRIEIWSNQPYHDNIRTFTKVTDGVDALKVNTNPIFSFFHDFDESGVLGLITCNLEPTSGKIFTMATFNNYFFDGFFFKVLGLNGVSSGFFQNGVFGVNMVGLTTKITATDLTGAKSFLTSCQIPTTTYFSLQTPFMYYGLGRTAGYVEELFVGKPTGQNFGWSGLIPNSQLVVNPASWDLEMYVSVSGAFL
jgi:integrin alpha FG-GAP repeat containing protein 1